MTGDGGFLLPLLIGIPLLGAIFVMCTPKGEQSLQRGLGIAFSLVPAVLWPAVAKYVEPNQLGTAYGLMTMLQNLGLTVANVVAGYINDTSGASASNPAGYASMLWFFGLLSVAGLLFATFLWRREAVQR